VVERVEVLDLGVVWDPNAPEAILASNDRGRAVLALNPRHDDEDQRCVVLLWTGTRSARLSDPNDEAISGHRLYRKGLAAVVWSGRVRDSETVRRLEQQNRVHPRHDPASFESLVHHIVLLKEGVAEVVAATLSIRRLNGSTLEALGTAMRE
jgi:hypothetical protein